MKKVLRITNPNVYAAYVNAPPLHPLVCILRYEELGLFRRSLNLYSVYGLFIQDEFVKGISYGMKTYETHGPSIICGGAGADRRRGRQRETDNPKGMGSPLVSGIDSRDRLGEKDGGIRFLLLLFQQVAGDDANGMGPDFPAHRPDA